jgi:asparagine synthetase B (glutamine-hydrolysing)
MKSTASASQSALDNWLVCIRMGANGLERGPSGSNMSGSPQIATRGSCTVLFDGLIYNGAELNGLVNTEGRPPENDAGHVLTLYLQFGEEMVRKVTGIYSLVVIDEERETVLGVRDRLGTFPLFFAHHNRYLLFSNSIDSLVSHPEVPRTINRAVIADQMLHRFPDSQETCYSNVRRVKSAHALRVVRGQEYMFRYWEPVPRDQSIDWASPEESATFDRVLDDTVRQFLRLGPTGIFLSGGLDSVSVAAAALDVCERIHMPRPLALSLVFPDPEANEEPIQTGVAHVLGLPQIIKPFHEAIGIDSLLTAALELNRDWPVPLLSPWVPAYNSLARSAKTTGCEVILTGGGGDEWLCVSPRFAADLIREFDLMGLHRLGMALYRSYFMRATDAAMAVLWRHGMRPILKQIWAGSSVRSAVLWAARQPFGDLIEKRRRRLFEFYTPLWIAPDQQLRSELLDRVQSSQNPPTSQTFYSRDVHHALDSAAYTIESEEQYESGRRAGVRILRPYWDADLLTLLVRTSPHILNAGGRTKSIVRKSLARRFPQLGFDQQKKVDASRFFCGEMVKEGERAWKSLGGLSALTQLGIVDPKPLKANLDAILSSDDGSEAYRVWDVLKMESWLQPRF